MASSRSPLIAASAIVCAVSVVSVTIVARQGNADRPVFPKSFGGEKTVVITPHSVARLLIDPTEQPWKPQVNTERQRGDVAKLYARVAPAVVVIRTDSGHGTGFLIDATGTIVTNHHVIADGLRHDPVRRASYAMVHVGTVSPDGTMAVQREARRAYVHKFDVTVDLAVLRVDHVGAALPFLPLSDAAPKPGAAVVAIGHPAAGLLWTVRTGEVSAAGRMPSDLVDVMMMRLAAAAARRDRIAAELERLPSRRIVLTSMSINPGDSGGPITDLQGRVVAVTFAVPRNPSLAKFGYHVHLDELKAFVKSVPASPTLMVPDAWAIGPEVELGDVDGDRRPDVLAAGEDGEVSALLLDVDNDTPAAAFRDVGALVSARTWELEAAIHRVADGAIGFYDSDNNGTIDVILSAGDDAAANVRFTRAAGGQWQIEVGKPLRAISAAHFKVPAIGRRFEQLMAQIARQPKTEKQ